MAAQAGVEILRQGGNAIDAAVAAGAVLDVTSQNDTGIGGDLFALVWSARDKKLYALNSGGWAPAAWTPQFFTEKLGVEKRSRGGSQFGHRARRNLGLRRAAETIREHDVRTDVRARGADRRRRLGPGRTSPRRSCGAPPTDCARTPIRGRRSSSAIARPTCTASSAIPRSQRRCVFCRSKGAMRSTAARSPPPSSPRCRANGGVMTQRRPRGVPVGVGRSDFDDLSRVRRVRAAAARAGICRAADAEHSRGVRAEARARVWRSSGRPIRCIGT